MKRFFTLLVMGLLSHGFGLSQQIPDLVAQHGYADMILVNGKIVTMDDWSIVPNTPGNIFQSMAIKGKKIMALGTNAEMRALAGPQTHLFELSPHFSHQDPAKRRKGRKTEPWALAHGPAG